MDIEQKALELVNEVELREGLSELTPRIMRGLIMDEALCRAIEQHEAFKREVSDALREWGVVEDGMYLSRFIIAKPDPLVEVAEDLKETYCVTGKDWADALRAALAKRGGKIVWEDGQ